MRMQHLIHGFMTVSELTDEDRANGWEPEIIEVEPEELDEPVKPKPVTRRK